MTYTLAIACCLSACTIIRSDPDGSRRVIGLADVEVTPTARSSGLTGDVVTVRAVGLTLSMLEVNAGLSFGYYRGTQVELRDCGSAPTPDRPRADTPRRTAAFDRGYAMERTLPDNGKGFFGLVDVTVPPSEIAPDRAATFGESEVIGLGFARHPQGLDVIVGYSRTTLLAIENDVMVTLGANSDDCRMTEPSRAARAHDGHPGGDAGRYARRRGAIETNVTLRKEAHLP